MDVLPSCDKRHPSLSRARGVADGPEWVDLTAQFAWECSPDREHVREVLGFGGADVDLHRRSRNASTYLGLHVSQSWKRASWSLRNDRSWSF